MKTVIRNEADRNRAVEIVKRVPIDPPQEIEIREWKKNRSSSQHRLYWQWNTVIAAELGETKEEVHERNKERFLVPIMWRDDANYSEMIGYIQEVHKQGMKSQAWALKRQVVRLTTTTQLNVMQFTEYLNEIEADARNLGIVLPHPEDLYNDAMGRRA